MARGLHSTWNEMVIAMRKVLKSGSLCKQLVAIFCLFAGPLVASIFDLNMQEMGEVVKIARSIHLVQPNLDDAKYIEYAVGIYRASRQYDVDPDVLMAITQRETSFRENLPEGKAGEIGICQILKSWLKNRKFRSEFRNASLKDMHKSAKSFLFAAWILRDLKESSRGGTLPYWSYYNARRYENRFKYFISVNRNLNVLRKYESLYDDAYTVSDTSRKVGRTPTKSVKPISYGKIRSPSPSQSIGAGRAPNQVSSISKAGSRTRWTPEIRREPNQSVVKTPVRWGLPRVRATAKSSPPYPLLKVAAELGVSEQWIIDAFAIPY